jgi:hypothetical protein
MLEDRPVIVHLRRGGIEKMEDFLRKVGQQLREGLHHLGVYLEIRTDETGKEIDDEPLTNPVAAADALEQERRDFDQLASSMGLDPPAEKRQRRPQEWRTGLSLQCLEEREVLPKNVREAIALAISENYIEALEGGRSLGATCSCIRCEDEILGDQIENGRFPVSRRRFFLRGYQFGRLGNAAIRPQKVAFVAAWLAELRRSE